MAGFFEYFVIIPFVVYILCFNFELIFPSFQKLFTCIKILVCFSEFIAVLFAILILFKSILSNSFSNSH